jgi:hypothetical protein
MKCDCGSSEYLFVIDYEASVYWSEYTGGDPAKFVINRYCKECRKQEGYIDLSDKDRPLSTLEFTSPELAEWFEKKVKK